jgi:hypothetical protein
MEREGGSLPSSKFLPPWLKNLVREKATDEAERVARMPPEVFISLPIAQRMEKSGSSIFFSPNKTVLEKVSLAILPLLHHLLETLTTAISFLRGRFGHLWIVSSMVC